ncbi:BTAD domain-containing putative transcriptional regulator [Asanoa iriomotensis]|uniref:SARP family transcriptional regulator n=1 Tax=Asanoa iriomotensis TaxID=234613 RepID=A0ABQ4CD88_9ACTN|nr:SARP family transcriptional regulator [Asanoa iriomotensis]
MEFRLLGSLEVQADGRRLVVGGVRSQLVLVGLLLAAGRTVSVDELVELVWDTEPPTTARKQLQTVVSRLRRLFATHPGAVLSTDPAGYRLDVDRARTDLGRFTTGLATARALVTGGDLTGAAAAFRAALALWRGPALVGLPGQAVALHAHRLDELRLAALEECGEVELRLGRHRQVLPELQTLAGAHPLRERITGLLMRALAADGRHAEAITVYHERAATLRDELGVEPGPELRAVYLTTIGGDGHTVVAPAPEPPPPRALPRPPRRLVGRDRLLAELTDDVRPRLLLIDGMPGVGKSALAITLAYRLAAGARDGQLYIDLHGHSERAPASRYDALGTLLEQVRPAPDAMPDTEAGRLAGWHAGMAARGGVVVLDNAASAEQVEPLLPAGAGWVTIVTSRHRLAPIDGARQLSLPPLDLADGVDLLRQSAGRHDAEVTEGQREVVRLCGRLPLAIRLAGHRLKHRPHWTFEMLADQLRDAPAPLHVSAERHSVAAAFAWSYRQLTAEEQLLFRRVGLHPSGHFEDWAAAALADLPVDETRRLLDQLVEVNLVEADVPGRFRMHDLLQAFAATLVDEPERGAAVDRMLDHYLRTTADANRHREFGDNVEHPMLNLTGRPFTDEHDRLAWMRTYWPTVAAVADLAHRSGAHLHACLLFRAASPFTLGHGHNATAVQLGQQALESARRLGTDDLRAMCHRIIAGHLLRLGHHSACRAHLGRAADLYHRLGDARLLSTVYANLSVVSRYEGRLSEALDSALTAETYAAAAGTPGRLAYARLQAGTAARYLGRYEVALRHLRRTATAVWPHHRVGLGSALMELGCVHRDLGHPRVAALLLRRAAALKRQGSNIASAVEASSEYGRLLVTTGDPESALRIQQAVYDTVRELRDGFFEPAIGNDIGETLTALGRTVEAGAAHETALRQAKERRLRYEEARAWAGLAAALRRTDPGRAESAAATAYDLFIGAGMRPEEASAALSGGRRAGAQLDDGRAPC